MDKMNPTAIGFWRTLIGGITLLIINLFAGKSLRLNRQVLFYAALAGFAFAWDLFFWHRAVIYVGAGMATILGNTQVFSTAILAALFFKDRLSLRYVLSAIVAIVGLVLLVDIFNSVSFARENYLLGVMLGLATGISYASFLTILKHASKKQPGLSSRVFMVWISFFTALFMGAMTLIEQQPLLPPDMESVVVLVLLGVIVQAVGWWIITASMNFLENSIVALILLLQPALATV